MPMSHHWLVSNLTIFFCMWTRWLCLISLISLRILWISSVAFRCRSFVWCWSRCCILCWSHLLNKSTKGRDQLTSFFFGELTILSSRLDQLYQCNHLRHQVLVRHCHSNYFPHSNTPYICGRLGVHLTCYGLPLLYSRYWHWYLHIGGICKRLINYTCGYGKCLSS